MVAFRKKILRPGVYNVKTSTGRKINTFSRDRISKIVATGNKMLASGLKIPAPYAHRDGDKIVPKPLSKDETANWNSGINAGYWKSFEVDPEDNSLVGILEVPGDTKDTNTPAGKVGTTVQETSIYLQPEFVDGLDRTWEDALYHIALIDGKSVEPGQENFQEVEPSYMCIAMSDEISVDSKPGKPDGDGKPPEAPADVTPTDDAGVITQIVELIRDKLGMEMPEDTDASNFLDRLRTILTSQKSEGEEDLTQQPEGSEIPSSPVAMADTINKNSDETVVEDKKVQGLLNKLIKQTKEGLLLRMEAMVAAGKLGRNHADKLIKPEIEAIAMSLDDIDEAGSLPMTPVEMSLNLFDDTQVALTESTGGSVQPAGTAVLDPPQHAEDKELTRDEVKAVLDDLEY